MGLCKCPRKKVTSQFCFEHKVNVCEHCMISNHSKCVVGPYLQWLEDSSFQPVCLLCQDSLSSQECVRLMCYHIFHASCLNRYANELPPNTAPAGYTCPNCHRALFPSSSSSSSPVAVALQNQLSDVTWARVGLGLPLIDSPNKTMNSLNDSSMSMSNSIGSEHSIEQSRAGLNSVNMTASPSVPQVIHHNPSTSNSGVPLSVNNITNYISSSNSDSNFGFSSASGATRNRDSDYDARKSLLSDVDEDKYRHKSPMEFFSRWMRSHSTFIKGRNIGGQLTYRRWIIAGILIFIGICTLVHYFLKFGRESADHDPMLDPRFNPNIRNEEKFNLD